MEVFIFMLYQNEAQLVAASQLWGMEIVHQILYTAVNEGVPNTVGAYISNVR